jgi:hypothetical protein
VEQKPTVRGVQLARPRPRKEPGAGKPHVDETSFHFPDIPCHGIPPLAYHALRVHDHARKSSLAAPTSMPDYAFADRSS